MPYKDLEKKKAYVKEYNKKWYLAHKTQHRSNINAYKEELKKWFNDYKSKCKCSKCEENHPSCLEFHHTGEYKKSRAICKMVQSCCSKETILEEMKKCIVLCCNCHNKIHWGTVGKKWEETY